MNKVFGIKSVELKIMASGNGVVNWNGSFSFRGDGKELNNHTLPKLRGYTNETGKIKEDTGYKIKKSATEINFSENPMYISQNCIRHHMFKDQANDMHYASKKESHKDPKLLLASLSGLLRGFVIPKSQVKRKSPILIEDFVDQLGNGNYEQFGNSGSKEKEKNKSGKEVSSSIYSKTTFGETKYLSYASISIEDLQFISLDKKNDRQAAEVTEKNAPKLVEMILKTIKDCDFSDSRNPKAELGNFVRVGSIYAEPEYGILLNQDAIEILVENAIDIIENLSIRQAKGWMAVDSVEKDYNESNKMMRIKRFPDIIKETRHEEYAIYYSKV